MIGVSLGLFGLGEGLRGRGVGGLCRKFCVLFPSHRVIPGGKYGTLWFS
jgi:hypothetical protein